MTKSESTVEIRKGWREKPSVSAWKLSLSLTLHSPPLNFTFILSFYLSVLHDRQLVLENGELEQWRGWAGTIERKVQMSVKLSASFTQDQKSGLLQKNVFMIKLSGDLGDLQWERTSSSRVKLPIEQIISPLKRLNTTVCCFWPKANN